MTRRRRAPAGPAWQCVQARVRCAEGHDIVAPDWALFWPFRVTAPRFILCELHAKAHGHLRAARAFTLTRDDAMDVRARQAGGSDD